jgi:NAD(P)H-dependent FMN reductase
MSPSPRILALAGSTREASYNKKLVRLLAEGARTAGGEVTLVDLRDLSLPLFDEDLERAGPPPGARTLRDLFTTHGGFAIASPEYNSSITAVLKNAIDWASRPAAGEQALAPFKGKVAALVSASPGALGGLRGLVHLRAILGNIGVIVLPDQVAVPRAHEAFDEEGSLRDDRQRSGVVQLGAALVAAVSKLAG